jgi:hypothetical protein
MRSWWQGKQDEAYDASMRVRVGDKVDALEWQYKLSRNAWMSHVI